MKNIKHLLFKLIIGLWNIFPAKIWLSKVVQGIPRLKTKLYKDLRFKGNMTVKFDSSSFKIFNPGFTTIENELFWNGMSGWEQLPIKVWSQLAKESMTILDIGANTGLYSLVAGAVNDKANITAFEPVKRTFALLQKNKSLNNFENFEIVHMAVSNQSGMTTMFDVDANSQYSASLNENMLKGSSDIVTYSVPTLVLDDYFKEDSVKIDLIKLDVEMHEPEAIQGMKRIILKDKPSIIIEILNQEIGDEVEKLISNLNYQFFALDNLESPLKVDKLTYKDCQNFLIISEEKLKQLKF